MPKLLQINVCSAVLSTGKIAEDISKVAMSHGWDCYTAWGRLAKPSVSTQIRIGNKFDTGFHYLSHKLFDLEGLSSKTATQKFIHKIQKIQPDIIHLHNIHDHYLNYPLLFNFLANNNIPVVWTQHDCWTFTGGCMYYDLYQCENWKSKCVNCPEHRALFNDYTEKQYELKKEYLSKIKTLVYVPVSNWIADSLLQSHQKHRPIITIHNGIDTNLFRPSSSKKNDGKFRILGVAAVWSKRKGLEDFIKLRSLLPTEFEITIIGLNNSQIESLPSGIKGISRTTDIQELVKYYSEADVFVNPTYSDNFPTTNIESLSCGTPIITYRTGGSPEAIDDKTGIVIDQGDVNALYSAILNMKKQPLSTEDCRKRAESFFDKDKCFNKYLDLYKSLL